MASPGPQITLTVDQVAEFLLRNQFLLTSLELYQESVERGQESARLKALFTPSKLDDVINGEDAAAWAAASASMRPPRGNASKSASSEHSSAELAGRVALLEYELRQERQTTQDLRAELSQLLQTKDVLPPNQQTDASVHRKQKAPSSIEARILNFIVKRYLVSQGYKLTAISLSSESSQDLNHWSAVSEDFGVVRPEPPMLANLFRYFYGAINNADDTKAIYHALESSSQVIKELKKDLDSKTRQIAELQANNAQLAAKANGTKATGPATIVQSGSKQSLAAQNAKEANEQSAAQRLAEEKASEAQRSAQMAAELASAKEQAKKRLPQRIRDYAFLFVRDESELDDGARRIASEIAKLRNFQSVTSDNQATTVVLGDTLPDIVPGVILKKREELIPAIVATVCWHPDERKRQEMTYMLFNLIRVPNAHQRSVIMDGCVQLAALTGEERTGTELLPLAVEGISSPYEERRILSAEACGWLSPSVQHEMRLSLLLSILHQLSQDRSPVVRTAACVNLARLLVLEDKDKTGIDHRTGHASDSSTPDDSASVSKPAPSVLTIDPKKYTQLCEMVLSLLQDPDATVLLVARTTLMPVFGDFIERMQLLESKYLPSLLNRMVTLVGSKGTPDQKSAHEIDVHSEALVYLAPVLYENALLQSDFYEEVSKGFRGPKYSTGSKYVRSVSAFTEEEKRVLSDRFAQFFEHQAADGSLRPTSNKPKEDWTVLDWIISDFLPSVLQMTISLESDNMIVINALCNMLSTFTQEFGETFTRKVVLPLFQESMTKLRGSPKQRSRVAIVKTVAVITGLDEKDVAADIRQFILDIAMSQNGWTSEQFSTLQSAIQLLLEQFEDHKETVLVTMSELILHEDADVRRLVIRLYNALLTIVSTSDVTGRILPSLITMANDTDLNVRCDVIQSMGELTIMIQDNNTTGRITAQLESFITDNPKYKTVQQLIRTYGKILPSITPGFRDSFVLKQLVRLAKYTVDDEDTKRQKELAELLYDSYRALNGMSVGRDALRNHVIPGLKHLQKIGDLLPADKRTVVTNMISVMEQITAGGSSSNSTSSGGTTPGRKSIEKDPATNPAPSSSQPGSSGFSGFFSGWT